MFRKLSMLAIAFSLAGGGLGTSASVAQATPLAVAGTNAIFGSHRQISPVQERVYFNRPYLNVYYDGPYWGDDDDDDDVGPAVALGIMGLAAGAMAAHAAYGSRGVAYCERRFRSYDPRTGTYLGYDGRYHYCP